MVRTRSPANGGGRGDRLRRLARGAVFALVDDEQVAIGVLDEGRVAVFGLAGLGEDGDAFGAKLGDGGVNVVDGEGDTGVGAGVLLVFAEREGDGLGLELLPAGRVFPDGGIHAQ